MRAPRWQGFVLLALGVGLAANSVLGPLLTGWIRYHLGPSLLNQTIGLDAASLFVVAPLSVVAGVLILRGVRFGGLLAVGPGLYTVYMFVQYVVGPDYVRYDGNSQGFFPLHLALFILGATATVGGWASVRPEELPALGRRWQRWLPVLLFGLAGFLYLVMYPANLADAMSGNPSRAEYLENPTMFWTIALLDLGGAAPGAVAAGVGILHRRPWARVAAYAVIGWYALVSVSVAAMAVTMLVKGDESASLPGTAAFCVFAALLCTVAIVLYRTAYARGGGEPAIELEAPTGLSLGRRRAQEPDIPGGEATRSW